MNKKIVKEIFLFNKNRISTITTNSSTTNYYNKIIS